jgi:hypothetical protein
MQVVLKEMGHIQDVWNVQPQAAEHPLTVFYDTGAVDGSLYRYARMNFDVSLGFPALAKLALGAAVLLAGATGAAVWFITRRILRIRAGLSQGLVQNRHRT